MTNKQFQTLKKVVKIAQPNLDYTGKAFIHSLLKEMGIEVLNYLVHDSLYISFVLKDFSVINVTQDRNETKLAWTNKPKLVKEVTPEITTPTINTSSEKALMLADYLEAGFRLEEIREVKIIEGLYSAGMTSELYVGKSYKSSLVEVNTMTFDLIDVSPAVVNSDFFIDEILVTDWIESPDAGQSIDCGQENTNISDKFIPLVEWLKSKAPHQVKKARVKGTPIFSESVYLLTRDKVLLDDKTTKYDISQIEVR